MKEEGKRCPNRLLVKELFGVFSRGVAERFLRSGSVFFCGVLTIRGGTIVIAVAMSDVSNEGAGQLAGQDDAGQMRGLRVKVVCVGDAGGRMLHFLQLKAFPEVELAVVDTDATALASLKSVGEKVTIGTKTTQGLGTGGILDRGYKAANESADALGQMVAGCHLIFLLAGMGGGTGGGASAVVARIAKQAGCMVFAFVIMPGQLEPSRQVSAKKALDYLRERCELVVPVYFDCLLRPAEGMSSAMEAFRYGNTLIARGIEALCTLLFRKGTPNLDFATLRNVFPTLDNKTLFVLGHGHGNSSVALKEAMEELMKTSSLVQPQQEASHFSSVLVLFRSKMNLPMQEVSAVLKQISSRFGARENMVSSITVDASLGELLEICVFGTAGGVYPTVSAPHLPPEAKPRRTEETPTSAAPSFAPAELPEEGQAGGMTQDTITFEDDSGAHYFKGTKPLIIGGVNLDIPTYKRRKIKLAGPTH